MVYSIPVLGLRRDQCWAKTYRKFANADPTPAGDDEMAVFMHANDSEDGQDDDEEADEDRHVLSTTSLSTGFTGSSG